MPSIILGPGSQPTFMPGERINIAKNGLVTISKQFGCAYASAFSLLPATGSAHPVFSGVFSATTQLLREEGDLAIFSIDYEGITFQFDSLPAPVYSLLQGLSNEPIDSHPDFVKFGTAANGAIFNPDGTFKKFSSFLPIGATAATGTKNIKAGCSEYLNATMIWRKNWMSRVKPSSVADSGKIGTPEGDAPSLVSGANWLTGPYTIIDRGLGQIYEITLDWLGSGPNGWDPDIYGDGS